MPSRSFITVPRDPPSPEDPPAPGPSNFEKAHPVRTRYDVFFLDGPSHRQGQCSLGGPTIRGRRVLRVPCHEYGEWPGRHMSRMLR